MSVKRLCAVAVVGLAVGLAFASVVVSVIPLAVPPAVAARDPDPPPFSGPPTEGGDLDTFDMAGTWAVFATGKFVPRSPWESTWHVAGHPSFRNGRWTWQGSVHDDAWTEYRVRVAGRPCLMIRWDCRRAGSRWFSVNRWSEGWLDELTGDDGRTYAAVHVHEPLAELRLDAVAP